MNWSLALMIEPLPGAADIGLLAARALTGGFLVHGVWDNVISAERMREFVAFLAANAFPAPQLAAPLSVWTQLIAAFALILGLFTRLAGLLIATTFVVGYLMVHLDQTFREAWPALALVALGLIFATVGGGRWAADGWITRK